MQYNIIDKIYQGKAEGKKFLTWLIDPDKYTKDGLMDSLSDIKGGGIDFIFVGGSLMMADHLDDCLNLIKSQTNIPVILFPGNSLQVNERADGLLFLSLISGRNPDLLIGRHVETAPILKQSNLEVLPTGYMLIDTGRATTASYISHTFPIPFHKDDIALSTALAGEMLGLKFIYLDGGSGAQSPVSPSMINRVADNVEIPVIVGGGIRDANSVTQAFEAGADLVVVGNAIEEDRGLLSQIASMQNEKY